jgi:hypothetical protein
MECLGHSSRIKWRQADIKWPSTDVGGCQLYQPYLCPSLDINKWPFPVCLELQTNKVNKKNNDLFMPPETIRIDRNPFK